MVLVRAGVGSGRKTWTWVWVVRTCPSVVSFFSLLSSGNEIGFASTVYPFQGHWLALREGVGGVAGARREGSQGGSALSPFRDADKHTS